MTRRPCPSKTPKIKAVPGSPALIGESWLIHPGVSSLALELASKILTAFRRSSGRSSNFRQGGSGGSAFGSPYVTPALAPPWAAGKPMSLPNNASKHEQHEPVSAGCCALFASLV